MLFAGVKPGIYAQGKADPSSLPKRSFQWNQAERELGFLHYDEVFKAREIPNGNTVRKLPEGKPIAAFQKDGEKEKEFDNFFNDQKVAGLLVLQDGKIRLERYGLGLTDSGHWTSQSVAKSVTSTLVGAALKDGYIKSVDEFLTKYIPDLKGSAYDSVRIRHLLTMTTGVKWNENYTDPNSDIAKFYTAPIQPGMNETVSYLRQLPSEAKPGKKWVYKTAETHLLGVLVSAATGKSLSEYLSEKIWIPYGMEEEATWIIGRSAEEFAGCCLQARLRDFARFGQFILEGARINGKSVVPENWLQEATTTQVRVWGSWGYGYQWWTFDDGTFKALGIHGQMIYIDPPRKLVVAINSAWPEAESYRRQQVVSDFLKSLSQELDKENQEKE